MLHSSRQRHGLLAHRQTPVGIAERNLTPRCIAAAKDAPVTPYSVRKRRVLFEVVEPDRLFKVAQSP